MPDDIHGGVYQYNKNIDAKMMFALYISDNNPIVGW